MAKKKTRIIRGQQNIDGQRAWEVVNALAIKKDPAAIEIMRQVAQRYLTAPVEMQRRANDRQPGGSHYKDRPIQPWDFIHRNGIGFIAGNVIK